MHDAFGTAQHGTPCRCQFNPTLKQPSYAGHEIPVELVSGPQPDAPLRNRSPAVVHHQCSESLEVELVPSSVPNSIMARNGSNGTVHSQPLLQQQAQIPPSERQHRSGWAKARSRAHDLVEGSIDTWFEYSLLAVIFANVVALLIGSLPVNGKERCLGSDCLRLSDKYKSWFEAGEWISVAIFTVEYILRIWACIEDPTVKYHGPIVGRLYYALSFYPIIDLISILPNWISLFSIILDPFFAGEQYVESPDFTTAARIFRLVRIFKTDKYINAFSLLGSVLWQNRVLLLATSFYSSMVWVISATLLYYTERDNTDPEMQTHFQSIPGSMFPTLLMLTGEFPLANFSPLGQIIAGFVAVVAVAIFAVPTSVLGAGFTHAVQQSAHREWTIPVDVDT